MADNSLHPARCAGPKIMVSDKKTQLMGKIRLFFVIVFLFLLSTTACASQDNNGGTMTNENLTKPTRIVVRILDLDVALIAIPTGTYTPSPDPPTPVIIPSATFAPPAPSQVDSITPTPSCTNRAEFIKHLTIANNTALEPGQNFMKQWRIKNTGTCIWTTSYSLVFFSGESMGGPPEVVLPNQVQPGETIDLQIPMIAPLNNIAYTGNWVLKDPLGAIFGVGELGDRPIEVTIFVKPTPRPTPG